MTQPRKHHYVPQFYLRGFSSNGSSIFQIEKHDGRGYLCSIKDTAAIRDYHELDFEAAEDPHVLEKRLAEIESQLAEVLAQVIKSGIDSRVTHSRLIELTSLLRFRVPAFKQFIEESFRQSVLSTAKIMEQNGNFSPAPKGFESIFARNGVSVSIANWKCLEVMFELASDPKILDILASMAPSILRAPEGTFLLTSDQPVALFHPDTNPTDSYGVGFSTPDIQVSVPLSSRVLLLLTWDKDAPKERELTASEVDEFNRRTVVMADSLVFAPHTTDLFLATVVRYRHCSAGPNLHVLNGNDSALHISLCRPVMTADKYQHTT